MHIIEKANQVFELSTKIFNSVWRYDLIVVSGNHIKVANIICALVLFVIGVKYSTKFTLFLKQYIRTKIDHDKDTVNILEKIIIYPICILFVVTVLEISNIPLSTFAFVGGAFAVAVGFAAQPITANFISSIIIMIERPIKIGDLVESEGVTGIVTNIGARSVTITSLSNVEVFIPNTKITQNVLINWTVNGGIIEHNVKVKIAKNSNKEINPNTLITRFEDAINGYDFIPINHKTKVILSEIDERFIIFTIAFYSSLDKVKIREQIKNTVNLSLLNILEGYDFIINYPKMIEIKTTEK